MKERQIIQLGCLFGGTIALSALLYMSFKNKDSIKVNKKSERVPPLPVNNPKKEQPIKENKPTITNMEKGDAYMAPPSPKVETKQSANDEFPLKLGSEGKRVERLNVWLMRNYGFFGKIIPCFTEATAKMVKKYLKVDKVDQWLYKKHKMGNHVTEQIIMR